MLYLLCSQVQKFKKWKKKTSYFPFFSAAIQLISINPGDRPSLGSFHNDDNFHGGDFLSVVGGAEIDQLGNIHFLYGSKRIRLSKTFLLMEI